MRVAKALSCALYVPIQTTLSTLAGDSSRGLHLAYFLSQCQPGAEERANGHQQEVGRVFQVLAAREGSGDRIPNGSSKSFDHLIHRNGKNHFNPLEGTR